VLLSAGLPKVMGDYNAEPESKVVKKMLLLQTRLAFWLQSGGFKDIWILDFNGFGTIPIKERKIIDYILLVEISTFKKH
jgi:hypothetical protein